MVNKAFVSLRPRLVLIRLVVFDLRLEGEFGLLACRRARMSLTIMSPLCATAILETVWRAWRLQGWPRLLVLVILRCPLCDEQQTREVLLDGQARLRMQLQVRVIESLDCLR